MVDGGSQGGKPRRVQGLVLFDLVFAHSVGDPLAVLTENFKNSDPPQNLTDYVNVFRLKLYVSGELAREKLAKARGKMKNIYDPQAEWCQFSPGNQVLAQLPIVGLPFRARFTGPHTVLKQISEEKYLIASPERRKKSQLCHVNLLTPYYSCVIEPSVVKAHL